MMSTFVVQSFVFPKDEVKKAKRTQSVNIIKKGDKATSIFVVSHIPVISAL